MWKSRSHEDELMEAILDAGADDLKERRRLFQVLTSMENF